MRTRYPPLNTAVVLGRLIAAYAHPDRRRGKTSPTEAINGRLDALRRNALIARNCGR